MGNITKNDAVPVSHGPKHHKRPREVKVEDEASSPPGHRHRRRRRNTRSCTPSPSPSLGGNDNTLDEVNDEEASSAASLPASLDRHACLRCVKFLASEPDFKCEFPARSMKCTRCTRLNSKCELIPACADAEARLLLGLQAEYEKTSPCEAKILRQCIVDATENFAVTVRLAAQRQPKTLMDVNLALLRGQEEIVGLLHRIEAELTAQGREEKRKDMGKRRD
ncbi:hypothetical protein VE03_07782 [Pseudogymnoascus sp. 23342-1-I1]|nr:hypothetical protein VE03_07782 [Pseudogymnoascus sp. 23342-1-I1]